ncbi:Hypothetical_protein [Hexamita inflata]|uniref:Hypothetical_protein n=1 Tax=Hexamita inflata TaxID=28002 RepID=A0ABP1ISY8_9EUKA
MTLIIFQNKRYDIQKVQSFHRSRHRLISFLSICSFENRYSRTISAAHIQNLLNYGKEALCLNTRLLSEIENNAPRCGICEEKVAFGRKCQCGKTFHWWCCNQCQFCTNCSWE